VPTIPPRELGIAPHHQPLRMYIVLNVIVAFPHAPPSPFAYAGRDPQVIPPNVRVGKPTSERLSDAEYREGVVHGSRGSPKQRERVRSCHVVVFISFEFPEPLYLQLGSMLNRSSCVRMLHAVFQPRYLGLALHRRVPVNSFPVILVRVLGGFFDPVGARIG